MSKKIANIADLLEVPGMILLATYVLVYLVNVAVLYLANMFFPQQVVLGTFSMSPAWALLHSMGALALLNTFGVPIARLVERIRGRMLTDKEWMIKYFILNFVGLWLISRFSDQFGLGISSWYVAAILAVVLDMVQGLVMMQLEKMK